MIRHLTRNVLASLAILAGCQGCILVTRVPLTPEPPKSATAVVRGQSLTRQNAVEDLNVLVRTLENVHPNPYAFRSRDAFYSDRDQLLAALPDSLTRAEWWARIAPLIASLEDGHSLISNPFDESPKALQDLLVFPAEVRLDENRHLLVGTIHGNPPGLERGDRILSVNGKDVDALLDSWTKERSGDTLTGRMTDVADRFKTLLLIHSMFPPFVLKTAPAGGGERELVLEGTPANTEEDQTLFSYRVVEPGIGYMNFHSMTGDFGRFRRDLAAMFRSVKAESVTTLVVDVRQNGGGDDVMGEELLRYINEKPYRGWAGGEIKRSSELRSYDKSYYRLPFRWLPLYYLFKQERMIHRGPRGTLAEWEEQPVRKRERAEPFFSGPVCVLTGPYTFSAAVILADAIKTYRLATLIGEETGGHPNFFGDAYEFRLPHSGLLASISTASWVRANGDTADRSNVMPDIVVHTSAEEIREGRDPVLERAKRCPRVN